MTFGRLIEFVTDDSGKLSESRGLIIMVIGSYLVCAFVGFIRTGIFHDIPLNACGLVAALYAGNKFSPTTPFVSKATTPGSTI